MGAPDVGLVLASSTPPELIGSTARLAEELGFAELWIPEDYWFLGSVASLVRALSATERIPVGVGVMSALVRHPAVAAMEIACAERMFPGRVLPGIGLGIPPLMAQMGLNPPSQLSAIRESIAILRTLLAGEECAAGSAGDGVFEAKGIRLSHVPATPPPIYTGVLGPRMLRLSGEIADGTVVSAMSSPAYLRWLKGCVEEGVARRAEPPAAPHRLPTFAMYCVHDDPEKARAAVRPLVALYLSHLAASPLVSVNDFGPEVVELCERGGADAAGLIAKEMPDAWLDELTVAGDPATCARRIERLHEAGADSVVLMPLVAGDPDEVEATLRITAEQVLPMVGAG
ncbi:LLM class flavin-dependent oxidoreductase [Pseudonocardia sp.]|uniref:LLM class flavin-dependent oxidoreductase n=1 Tax=Pseudonocardia sp. TaxID=60912 RepID=UPI003D0E22A6